MLDKAWEPERDAPRHRPKRNETRNGLIRNDDQKWPQSKPDTEQHRTELNNQCECRLPIIKSTINTVHAGARLRQPRGNDPGGGGGPSLHWAIGQEIATKCYQIDVSGVAILHVLPMPRYWRGFSS